MNYRHGYHAGNFADVLKHVALVALLTRLMSKDKPLLVLDTHAGRGGYDLTGAQGDTTKEWKRGVGLLLPMRAPPDAIADYLDLVRRFDRKFGPMGKPPEGLSHYPGSPRLARAMLRAGDRLVAAELHRDEYRLLRREFAGDPMVETRETDGYALIRAALPPPERRALVHVDPPYETRDEAERALHAIGQGVRRLPTGVFALWYPIKDEVAARAIREGVAALSKAETLAVELRVATNAPAQSLYGTGIVVINPPWTFAERMREALEVLVRTLGANATARGDVFAVAKPAPVEAQVEAPQRRKRQAAPPR